MWKLLKCQGSLKVRDNVHRSGGCGAHVAFYAASKQSHNFLYIKMYL